MPQVKVFHSVSERDAYVQPKLMELSQKYSIICLSPETFTSVRRMGRDHYKIAEAGCKQGFMGYLLPSETMIFMHKGITSALGYTKIGEAFEVLYELDWEYAKSDSPQPAYRSERIEVTDEEGASFFEKLTGK